MAERNDNEKTEMEQLVEKYEREDREARKEIFQILAKIYGENVTTYFAARRLENMASFMKNDALMAVSLQ